MTEPDTTTIAGITYHHRAGPRYQCNADPRIIELQCSRCNTCWFVLIPEKNPRGFLGGLKCQCGIDASDRGPSGEILFVRGAVSKVRKILHGAMARP